MKAVRNMVNSFAELKVCAETVELLKQMGIKKPMPVQEQAIPALFAGRELSQERRQVLVKHWHF